MPALALPIYRQHTVSQVVLKRFAWRSKISVFDKQTNTVHSKGPRGMFFEHLDRFDPNRAEKEWQRVEDKMPDVYAALAARTALANPDTVQALRELMAVHWVRAPSMRLAHERVKQQVLQQSIQRLAQDTTFLSAAFTKQTGLVAAGNAELDWFNVRVHERVDEAHAAELFSDRLIQNYRTVLSILQRHHVQVGYADGTADSMIGDAPVITTKPGHDGVGPHQGVAVGDATLIVMPVCPRILIAMGPEAGETQLTDDEVNFYNGLQLKGFVRWFGCKPGGTSDTLLRRHARDEGIRVYP